MWFLLYWLFLSLGFLDICNIIVDKKSVDSIGRCLIMAILMDLLYHILVFVLALNTVIAVCCFRFFLGQMINNLSFHELLAEDAGLLLDIAFKDLEARPVWLALFLFLWRGNCCRLLGSEGRQINLRDLLEHTPAEDLTVTILVFVFDQLGWIDVHQHWVNIVTEAGQLSFLEYIAPYGTLFGGEVSLRLQHLVHVLGASVRIQANCSQQRSIIEQLFLSGLILSTSLEFVHSFLVHFRLDLERLTSFVLPVGPLRLMLLNYVDERFAKGALPEDGRVWFAG